MDEDDFIGAIYKALDKLEELDPKVKEEKWFALIEKKVDGTLKPLLLELWGPVIH